MAITNEQMSWRAGVQFFDGGGTLLTKSSGRAACGFTAPFPIRIREVHLTAVQTLATADYDIDLGTSADPDQICIAAGALNGSIDGTAVALIGAHAGGTTVVIKVHKLPLIVADTTNTLDIVDEGEAFNITFTAASGNGTCFWTVLYERIDGGDLTVLAS